MPREIPIDRLGEPRHPSPKTAGTRFVSDALYVRETIEVPPLPHAGEELLFEKAGARARVYFDPPDTRAAIVTCGGLCPGLNVVIRSLFLELHYNYGIADVLGVRHGYAGLDPASGLPLGPLTREQVEPIHQQGGTMLGTSRGSRDVGVMAETLARHRVNLLFCVGGDGTQRGALAISAEVKRRGLDLAVVGIPKTIDNDILYCDRTFGLVTAVERASEVIRLAHNEATGVPRGIGLVRVMGRDAGFIACLATLASMEANFCLIPESRFALDGPDGLLEVLRRRMARRGHAVIVVAEGAGQNLLADRPPEYDASGNRRKGDIGLFLRDRIPEYFRSVGEPVDLKYIDPSYAIRSAPANTDDVLLCDQLARHAAHAGMAGKTELMIGYLNGKFVHVPIAMAVAAKKQVALDAPLWASVLAATGQPARIGGDG